MRACDEAGVRAILAVLVARVSQRARVDGVELTIEAIRRGVVDSVMFGWDALRAEIAASGEGEESGLTADFINRAVEQAYAGAVASSEGTKVMKA